MKMKPLLTALMMALLVTACTGKGGSLDLRKPVSLNLEPPEGPPIYRQGWEDGCESGMHAYAADFYKSINAFEFRQDATLRQNRMYYQVWKDAYLYCAIFLNTTNRKI